MNESPIRDTGETQHQIQTSNITDPDSEELNSASPDKKKMNAFLANNEKHAQMQRALAMSFISSHG
jgi:hypothetical protein